MTEEQLNDEQAIDGMLWMAFCMGLHTPTILREIERGYRKESSARSLRVLAQMMGGTVALLRRTAEGESILRSSLEIPSGLDPETERLIRDVELLLGEGDSERQKLAQRMIAFIDRKNPQMGGKEEQE